MSDTATNGSLDAFLIDGDVPRLGGSTPIPAEPTTLDFETLVDEPGEQQAAEPTLTTLATAAADDVAVPTLPTPSLPQATVPAPMVTPDLPTSAPSALSSDGPPVADPRHHPMAHLMPAKSQPTEASLRAAQKRAEMKKKSRRTGVIVGVVLLAAAAVAGPPLVSWTIDAVNQAGTSQDESPATTAPATTAPAPSTPAASVPATTPATTAAPTGLGGLAGLPGEAETVVSAVNADMPEMTALPAPTAAP